MLMKKIILIPDSFKGTLSSIQICSIWSAKVQEYFPECQIISIPIADGGEGTVDCFLTALGGKKIKTFVKNPYFEEIESFYGLLNDGKTAVIEMAACAGLPLVESRKNPCCTTTYGVGQLILDAAQQGAKKIIIGLGGSSTNDGGCGAASAAGIQFYNKAGEIFIPVGGTLHEIERISFEKCNPLLNGIEIITMCDIDNPMYGPNGAAYVFAPQKGADPKAIDFLDEGLRHLAGILERDLHLNISQIPGTGAAGAMGAGMIAFFHSQLRMGIETILDTVHFSQILSDADMIFTGEGKFDQQSLHGKAVIGIAKRAKEKNIPVIVLAGGVDEDIDAAYEMGVSAVFSINRLPQKFSVSRYKSVENITAAFENILRLIKSLK